MIDIFDKRYEQIDDYEDILNCLYNNPNGVENRYTLYKRNNMVSDMMEEVDITSMSGEEVVELLYRKPLYIKVKEEE